MSNFKLKKEYDRIVNNEFKKEKIENKDILFDNKKSYAVNISKNKKIN